MGNFIIKVIGDKGERLERCDRITFTHLDDSLEAWLGPSGVTLSLPTDGDKLYVMNENGDTVDSHRWPPIVASSKVREVG